MKKSLEDAFCPNCEWSGDATGITACPLCGSDLSMLDTVEGDDSLAHGSKEYPTEILARVQGDEDEFPE